MSETHQYLIFTINLTDLAQVQAAQVYPSRSGSGVGAILDVAPETAALGPYEPALYRYAAPILGRHAKFVAPSITSEWFGTSDQFPTNVGTFDRKSGGWFGWGWLFGDTTHYHWRGIFKYVAPDVAVPYPNPIQVPTRRWIDGFEFPPGGEGGGGSLTYSRGSSRHPDGMGLALKHLSAARSHLTTENGGANPRDSWERFYVRLRRAPAAQAALWRAKSLASPAAGFAIYILPTAQLALYEVDSIGTLTLLATIGTALPLNVWVRLDIFLAFGQNPSATASPGLQIFINGISQLNFVQALTHALQTDTERHTSSELGGTVATTLAIDIDDWINAALPRQGVGGIVDVRGVDWQAGTKIVLLNAMGLAAAVNWTGDFRSLIKNPQPTALGGSTVTSVTNGAVLTIDTDWQDQVSAQPGATGLVTLLAVIKATTVTAAATLGFIGTELAGALTGVIVQDASNFMRWLVQVGAGATTLLKPNAPIQITHAHGTGALETIYGLYGLAEVAGTYGPEDAGYKPDVAFSRDNLLVSPIPKTLSPYFGPHNSPYPRTPWARQTTTPQQPVYVKGGTYVGNSTGQELLFPVPINWIWIRPAAGAGAGAKWFSSMMGATKGIEQQIQADGMVQAREDTTFVPGPLDAQQAQYMIRIAGADAQWNQNAITYQYVAVGDPGMRFMCNGVIGDHRGTVDYTTLLANAGFVPLATFFKQEQISGSGTVGFFYKGPGHATANVSWLDSSGEIAAAVSHGAGLILTKSAFMGNNAFDGIPFSSWRTNDGGLSAGVTNNGQVVQLFSYVGDGAASRTVNCTPTSGRRPMFAIVVPHNAAPQWRDPSHTGTTCSVVSTGTLTAANAIVGGGIDSISVGVTLNANGIVYDVFCIPGDATAGNAGWGVNVAVMPVSPDPPSDAPGDPAAIGPEPPAAPVIDPVVPVVIPDPLPPTGPMPGLTDDLAAACEPDTRSRINVALTRIGISKQIANVATDQTPEAAAARLVYAEAVQETLRDFPWPFATRYVKLTQVSVTRPNSDWLYSYRQPNDCVLERRIVISRTDAANPDQIPFQLSSDFDPGDAIAAPPIAASGGGLIFTNLANAVLEYTARPKCPHTKSEPLFRDAVCWKIAAALAPSLTRMSERVAECVKEYNAAIAQAYVVLRPGNPGEMPSAAIVDTSAAAKAANLSVVNLALIQIGAPTIVALATDQSRSAQIARMIFEQELQSVLRDFPWSFATVYATPAVVGGTATVALNSDWQYSYRLPADVVYVRRLVNTNGRSYERLPFPFKVAVDATGGLLYTSAPAAVIEYTGRIEAAVQRADANFREALAWRLSWKFAPSLAQIVPERPEAIGRGPDETALQGKDRPATGQQLRAAAARSARDTYYFALQTARATSFDEQQTDATPINSDWIDARDSGTIGDGDGPLGFRRWR